MSDGAVLSPLPYAEPAVIVVEIPGPPGPDGKATPEFRQGVKIVEEGRAAVEGDVKQTAADRVVVEAARTEAANSRDVAVTAGNLAVEKADIAVTKAGEAAGQAIISKTQAELSVAARNAADAFAANAQLSAQSAQVTGQLYPTIAAGETATADANGPIVGKIFNVVAASETNAIDIRERTANGSTLLRTIPAAPRVEALETRISFANVPGFALTIDDPSGNVVFGLHDDPLLTPSNPHYEQTVGRVTGLEKIVDRSVRTLWAGEIVDDLDNLLLGIRNDALLSLDNPDINLMRARIESLRALGMEIVSRPGWILVVEDLQQNVIFGIRDNLEIVSPTIARLESLIATGAGSAHVIDPMVPDAIYAVVGETTYVNTDGIILDPTINVVWDKPYATEAVCPITPTSTAADTARLYGYGADNALFTIAEIPIYVTGTPVSPSVPQNIVTLGDSKTLGSAGVDYGGIYPNELSRLLTGIGRAALSGAQSPAPLNLSNIYFRGTLGNEVVKHEGRAGWEFTKYLNTASTSSDTGPNGEVTPGQTNAFFNPTTQKFDMVYWATQNGFRSVDTPTGIVSDGSNLTIIIWMGWNDAYNQTPASSAAELAQMIDLIHAGYPQAKVIVMGLNPAPKSNLKSFNGSRMVSQRSIWESIIKPFGKAYREVCKTKPNTIFYQLSHLMDANLAHNTTTRPISSRSTVTVTGNGDYVHENLVGNAMVADAVKRVLLYLLCR